MAQNYDIAEKSVRAAAASNASQASGNRKGRTTVKKRLAGGSWWRTMIDDLIASEKADLREMRELRDRTRDMDTMRLLTVLYERKMQRVLELSALMEYRGGSEANEPDTGSEAVSTPEWWK